MPQLATITSKRQLTIPAEIFRRLNLKKGYKVIVSQEKETIKIEPVLNLIERLAGAVKIPANFKGLPIEKIIIKAKKEYFKRQ